MVHAHGCPFPLSPICGAGGLAGQIVSTFFSVLTGWVNAAAGWLLSQVGTALDRSTAPPVTSAWFLARQRAILAVAAPIGLLALVAAAIHAVVHDAGAQLVRTVLVRLPVAVLLGAASAGVVGVALGATDQLCAELSAGSSTSITTSLQGLSGLAQSVSGVPGAVSVVISVLVIAGALLLWVELIVRAAAITVATALLPLIFAASLWPPGVAWARRVVETLGALIISKAVIVLVLTIALDAIVHAGAGASTVLTGGALLVLATCMPYAVLRLVPAFEAAAVSHLEGVRHRGSAAVTQGTGRAVSMALAAADRSIVPGVDPVGSDPIGMFPGVDVDPIAGSPLDPSARFVKGRPPIRAVPASSGTHVWERDTYGPKLVWKPGRGHSA